MSMKRAFVRRLLRGGNTSLPSAHIYLLTDQVPRIRVYKVCILSEVMDSLHKIVCSKTGARTPMLSDHHHTIIMENADKLNSAIIYDRDFSYNYFGFKVPCSIL